MKSKKGFAKRFMSFALSTAMTLGLVPAVSFAVGESNATLTADTSTYSSYQEFFHIGSGQTLSTENAGAVWTDKSVMTIGNRPDTTVNMEDDSFLVALSAMGSNMTIVGESDVPTDTILVLDISGSMNNNQGNNDVAEDLVDAANATIAALLEMNSSSRIGVALYSGTSSSSTNENASRVILPLDRYTTDSDGKYLTYTEYWGDEYVGIDSDVRNSNGNAPTSQSIEVVGATYIQKGVLSAIQQLTASSNTATTNRKPIVVLMSDGAPTLGSSSYTNPGQYNLGNGSTPSAALAFVTQLTLSYAKNQIKTKYNTDPLFYTLGLGVDNNALAMSVLNPTSANASTAVNDFWTMWDEASQDDEITVQAATDGRNPRPAVTVTKMNGLTKNYVDGYYTAAVSSIGGNSLTDAFEDIVAEIQLQTKYYPTLVGSSEDVSGYVSFVDRIGKYMKVTDIKGVYLGGVLHTGATFAEGLENGTFGSAANPTTAGDELVWAVQNRIGVDVDTARTLLGNAYTDGQLSYTSDTEYSNYIGWFADANGNFLDYWDGTPDEKLAGATFRVKCYGFYGQVGVDDGTSETDMMYIIVQLRENIATGEQMMTFAVPAALLPIVSYNVSLDENGDVESLEATGATKPIRLVYEVALDEEITEYTINDVVDADYISANTADGYVSFYSNQYEVDNSVGYGKVNTYSYFNPSKQNNRYYFTEDTLVYANTSGALATGSQPSSGYSRKAIYTENSVTYHYHEIHSSVLADAQPNDDGSWYIPAGYVHVHTGEYDIVSKEPNATGTLPWVEVPYVDATGHSLNDTGYDYVVGATLGNNGKLTVKPQTGIKITKTMADGVAAPTTAFEFEITGAADGSYEAFHIDANGAETAKTVTFSGGKATVELKADETLYIGDMVANWVITVTEIETKDYVAEDSTESVVLVANEISKIDFVNSERKTGHLTIGKEITHPFGTSFSIPEEKTFTMTVTLSGTDVANKSFNASQTKDSTVSSVYVDSNGQFIVTLKNDDQIQILELPEGTVATVVESAPGAGFTAYYLDNGEAGDGIVEVRANNTSSVIVVNDYVPGKVDPVNLIVKGTKNLLDSEKNPVAWEDNYSFTFVIERFNASTNAWENAGTDTVTYNDTEKTFEFNLENENYDKAGVYSYQIKEVKPDDTIDGMYYDVTVHTFSVTVEDKDMDGKLEITKVHSDHSGREFAQVNNTWVVDVSFTNIVYEKTPAVVEIPIQKELINSSGSDKVNYSGYEFELYKDEACTTPVSAGGLLASINKDVTDAIGEGFIDLVFNHVENTTYPQTFTYYIKEKSGSIPNMDYSDDIVKVDITISDNGDGSSIILEAAVNYTEVVNDDNVLLNADNELVFTNEYKPVSESLEIDFVNKNLTGKALEAGEFHFVATEYDSNLSATGRVLYGTNNAAGKVTFYTDATYTTEASFSYDTVGTFAYAITEVDEGKTGYSYDKTTYRVIVTVTDVNGQLTASYSIANAAGNEVTFYNTYAPVATTYTISGTKTLTGRVLLNDEFTFVLTDEYGNEYKAENGSANGGYKAAFTFPELTYTEPGTYKYTVTENKTSGASFGITYSTAEYDVIVTVEDIGGQLVATADLDADDISFVNTYTAAPTNIQIPGDKELTGKVISDYNGDFTFNLYESDSTYAIKNIKESTTNDSNGDFTFGQIDYSTAGSYYYIVDEVEGSIPGIKYDESVYHVRVDVVDNYLGQLVATIHVYDSNGIPQDGVVFHNIYGISDDASASVSIEGNKTYTYNGTPKAFEYGAFEFDLYQTDETFDVSGSTPKTTSTSSALNGEFSFAFEYGKADVTNTSGTKYYYVIKEKNGGTTNAGIIYDGTEYHIVVTLSDDGEGGIATDVKYYKATSSGDVSTSSIDFANTYAVDGDASVEISGNKTYDKSFEDGDFKVEISGVNAPVNISANGIWNYMFNYTEENLGTHTYTIKEQNANTTVNGITYDSKEYTLTVVVEDDLNGGIKATATVNDSNVVVSGTETAITVSGLDFTNTYAVAENAADSVTVGGEKSFNKTFEDGDFKVEIYKGNDKFDTVDILANGTWSYTFNYGKNNIGQHVYTIKEVNAGETIDGITYDKAQYEVTVLVSDNGLGGISAEIISVVATETTEVATIDSAKTSASGLDFTNVYAVTGSASVDFSGMKTLNSVASSKEFTFELYETDSTYTVADGATALQVKTNSTNGAIVFETLQYSADKVGSIYYYVVKEVDEGAGGYDYDDNEYKIKVEILDNGVGGIKTRVTVNNGTPAETNEITSLNFANTYTILGDVTVVLPGTKTLNNVLTDKPFTFELYKANSAFEISGTAIDSVKNGADGKFEFELTYTGADSINTYHYVAKEKNEGVGGYNYDSDEYYITVIIEDNGDGTLKKTVTISDGTNEVVSLDFQNTYEITGSDSVIFSGTKTFNKGFKGNDFTFELYSTDVNFNDLTFVRDDITNDVNGDYSFSIEYGPSDEGKTYYYVFREEKAGSTEDGIKYSSVEYWITVKVEDNGEGGVEATATVTSDNGQTVESETALDFTNTYEVSGDASASVILSGEKSFNQDFGANKFTFQLYSVDDDSYTIKDGSTPATVKNDADKKYSFALNYTKDDLNKTYYYVVKEENAGQTIDGITYDSKEYKIQVEVKDDGKGGITATASEVSGAEIEKLNFTNTYAVSENAADSVTVGGEKSFNKTFEDGDFKVEIYKGNDKLSTVDILANGTWSYTFNYGKDDIGTYEYTIKEVNASQAIDGITYDSKIYTLTVVVEDNGFGGIEATASEVSGAELENLDFTNTYTVKGNVNVTLSGTKTLIGKVLEAGKFSFKLYETDSTFANAVENGYSKVETYTVNDQFLGEFKFELAYDETHVGNTYYYVIEEEAGTLGGVSYDETKYHVTVKVEDNGDGKVKASVKIGDGEFTSKVNENIALNGIDFKNEYSVSGNISITLAGNKIYNIPFSDNSFTFELYKTDSNYATENVTPVTAQNINGAYSFSLDYSNITLDDIGNIDYYVIKEAAVQNNLIVTDTNEYRVSVEIIDNEDGTASAKLFVQKFGSDGAALNSGYTVIDPDNVTISGLDFTNTFNGTYVIYFEGQKFFDKAFNPGDFTFELYPANDKYEITGGAFITTANEVGGKYGMTLVCTAEDVGQTYYFVLKEKYAGQKINGIVYDSNEYKIKVVVRGDTDYIDAFVWVEDSNGKTDFGGAGGPTGQSVEGLNFTNKYQPTATSTVIGGVKELWGRILGNSEFRFMLYTADSNFAINNEIAPKTAYNSANGSFSFGNISLTEPKTYYFVVMEDTSVPMARVTYDRSVYYVSIDVSDDGTGQLVAGVPVITKGSNHAPANGIKFVNYYTPAPSPVVMNVLAHKTVKNVGTEVIGPEGFEFVLYNVTQGRTYRATSGKDGLAAFSLMFSESDIGHTYIYKMYEVNGGRENVEYSRVEHTITVYVYLGGGNRINTIVTLDGTQVDMAVAEFENIYNYTPYVPDDPEDPEDPDDPIIPDVPVDPPVDPEDPEDPDDPVNPGTTDSIGFVMIALGFIFGFLSIAVFKKKKA